MGHLSDYDLTFHTCIYLLVLFIGFGAELTLLRSFDVLSSFAKGGPEYLFINYFKLK